MFIYFFESSLFPSEQRKLISSFPIPRIVLEEMVNYDNDYPEDKRWRLVR